MLIRDNEGSGLPWANSQIHENKSRVNGKWVYVLDDDDYLIDPSFIEGLKKIDKVTDAKIIICKGYINEKLYPPPGFWKHIPIRGTIGSPNFIVRKEVFLKHSYKWCQRKAGDYFFIKEAYGYEEVHWWNKTVFYAPVGNGLPETSSHFKDIQEEYDRHQNSVHAGHAAGQSV